MLRSTNARYWFGQPLMAIEPLNYDLTVPWPDRVVGGPGPFDFSGYATPAAVPLSIRFDTETVMTFNLNVSGIPGVVLTAVTAAQLAVLINAAGFTDVLATVEAVTGYLMIEDTSTGAAHTFVQVYGAAAELSLIGQGKGCKFIIIDTTETLEISPDIQAGEKLELEDANALKTWIFTDSKRLGWKGTWTDTACDPYVKRILQGGSYTVDPITGLGVYVAPLDTEAKTYFWMMTFQSCYARGANAKSDFLWYLWSKYWKGVADLGSETQGKSWVKVPYTLTGMAPKTSAGVAYGDTEEEELSKADFETLDVANL